MKSTIIFFLTIYLCLGSFSEINAQRRTNRSQPQKTTQTQEPKTKPATQTGKKEVQSQKDSPSQLNQKLLEAAAKGNTVTLQSLLSRGADINTKNENEQSALMVAAAHGQLEIVKVLLAKGVNLSAEDKGGRTALTFATIAGHSDIVRELLIKGAIARPSDMIASAIGRAAPTSGQTAVVELLMAQLLAKGESSETQTSFKASLFYARERCHNEVEKLFRDKGVQLSDTEKLQMAFSTISISSDLSVSHDASMTLIGFEDLVLCKSRLLRGDSALTCWLQNKFKECMWGYTFDSSHHSNQIIWWCI